MRQLVITRYGPPEVLAVREAPDPPVIPGSVRIRVAAAGINFSDVMARQGLYPDAPKADHQIIAAGGCDQGSTIRFV